MGGLENTYEYGWEGLVTLLRVRVSEPKLQRGRRGCRRCQGWGREASFSSRDEGGFFQHRLLGGSGVWWEAGMPCSLGDFEEVARSSQGGNCYVVVLLPACVQEV